MGEYRDWHLSTPSPELLEALDSGWFPPRGRILDLGTGLGTEPTFLANRGFIVVGVDLSLVALRRAGASGRGAKFVRADARRLPFQDGTFDALLDRGCFPYVTGGDRTKYIREARRVLRPDGRLLLRACLQARGVRNDLSADLIKEMFEGLHWRIVRLEHRGIPSDTRMMDALVVWLERPHVAWLAQP
jgi:SAM-dependent methyltransferase